MKKRENILTCNIEEDTGLIVGPWIDVGKRLLKDHTLTGLVAFLWHAGYDPSRMELGVSTYKNEEVGVLKNINWQYLFPDPIEEWERAVFQSCNFRYVVKKQCKDIEQALASF